MKIKDLKGDGRGICTVRECSVGIRRNHHKPSLDHSVFIQCTFRVPVTAQCLSGKSPIFLLIL
jgi:hypothetical protein